MFRDPKKDKRKTLSKIKEQVEQGLMCTAPGCNKPISHHQGPNADKLCRSCMLKQRDYEGGMGRGDRIHTMARGNSCEICNYTPAEDPEIIKAAGGDLVELNRHARSQLEVNHIDGDHENNDPKNLQTLCLKHHRIITIKEKHYAKRG
jgi:hypothetical protein